MPLKSSKVVTTNVPREICVTSGGELRGESGSGFGGIGRFSESEEKIVNLMVVLVLLLEAILSIGSMIVKKFSPCMSWLTYSSSHPKKYFL